MVPKLTAVFEPWVVVKIILEARSVGVSLCYGGAKTRCDAFTGSESLLLT